MTLRLNKLRLRLPFAVPLIEAPGVVPGVSYSGEVARDELPIEGIVVSVGDFDDEPFAGFCGAMTGIETSLS